MPLRDFDDAALTRAGRVLALDLGPAEPLLPRALEPRALERARPRTAWPLLRRCIGAAAVIALLSILASEQREAQRAEAAAALAAAPPWEAVAADRYRLDGDEEVRASARRRPSLGLREDSLASGAFGDIGRPFLRITLAEAPDPDASLFVTLARRAADPDGLAVLRTGERGQVESRFGAVETAEATLSGPEGTRSCAAFRLLDNSLRLDGWLCAPLGQPPEPAAIGCALDRLTARPGVLMPAAIVDLLTRPARPVCAPPASASIAASAAAPGVAPAAAITPRKGRDRRNAAKVRQSAQALQEPGTTAALGRHPDASR
ncbi:hypothetical protein [Methylobacterium sp. JK268]